MALKIELPGITKAEKAASLTKTVLVLIALLALLYLLFAVFGVVPIGRMTFPLPSKGLIGIAVLIGIAFLVYLLLKPAAEAAGGGVTAPTTTEKEGIISTILGKMEESRRRKEEKAAKKRRDISVIKSPDRVVATGESKIIVAVKDQEGNAVRGVPVKIDIIGGEGTINGKESFTGKTDDSGQIMAVLKTGPDPGPNTVRISAPNTINSPVIETVEAEPLKPTGLELEEFKKPVPLKHEIRVKGRVIYPDGRPRAGAKVIFSEGPNKTADIAIPPDAQSTTEADGSFEYIIPNTGDVEGRIVIKASLSTDETVSDSVEIRVKMIPDKIEITSPPGYKECCVGETVNIKGRVLDKRGNALKNHKVKIAIGTMGKALTRESEVETWTDPKGKFAKDIRLGGRFNVLEHAEIYVSSSEFPNVSRKRKIKILPVRIEAYPYQDTEFSENMKQNKKAIVQVLEEISKEKNIDFAIPIGSKLGFKVEIFAGSEKHANPVNIIAYEAKAEDKSMMLWEKNEKKAVKKTEEGEATYKKPDIFGGEHKGRHVYMFAVATKKNGRWFPSDIRTVKRLLVLTYKEIIKKAGDVIAIRAQEEGINVIPPGAKEVRKKIFEVPHIKG